MYVQVKYNLFLRNEELLKILVQIISIDLSKILFHVKNVNERRVFNY